MKIVCIDNFNRDEVDDVLICENIDKHYGLMIVAYLNERLSGNESPIYFKLENDDYELYIFKP